MSWSHPANVFRLWLLPVDSSSSTPERGAGSYEDFDGLLGDTNSISSAMTTRCSAATGTYFPAVRLENNTAGIAATYYRDPVVSATHYTVAQSCAAGTCTSNSGLAIPTIEMTRLSGVPDLAVTINSVTHSGGQVTVNRTIENVGTGYIADVQLAIWLDPASPPTSLASSDPDYGPAPVPNFICISPGLTVTSNSVIASSLTTGTAYVAVGGPSASYIVGDNNPSNDVSASFNW